MSMSDRPRDGESWTCRKCGKAVLGGGNWGIAPSAVCACQIPDASPASPIFTGTLNPDVEQLRAANARLRKALEEIATMLSIAEPSAARIAREALEGR